MGLSGGPCARERGIHDTVCTLSGRQGGIQGAQACDTDGGLSVAGSCLWPHDSVALTAHRARLVGMYSVLAWRPSLTARSPWCGMS
jgi:hypothetical protein